ncbi:MAG: DUF1592 domain-containing protein [Planctomycetales bacterium]|nr:DUF1592 domain-containing protein [Planctomycetales bacterium]
MLSRSLTIWGAFCVCTLGVSGPLPGQEEPTQNRDEPSLPCPATDDASLRTFFVDQVWANVGAARCLNCHKAGGDAGDSRFVLLDPERAVEEERDRFLAVNQDQFLARTIDRDGGESRLLLKALGELEHGGEQVLERDSVEYRILLEWQRRLESPGNMDSPGIEASEPDDRESDSTAYFAGVTRLDDRQLLRRATLSLAGRLPTPAELAAVSTGEAAALDAVLDGVMTEESFYVRLREGFNDIFLFLGVDGNPDQTVISYEHFEQTRHWYQHHDLSHIADEDERRRAGYQLANDYRRAILEEPLWLIDHIVRDNRPFTEIVTADYIMVSPYTARGYGIFDELRERFADPEDPFEFIPVQLKALRGRNESENQESDTGFYPHAGVLSTFQYLSRYGTTETNRNRLRARMYYQHFLDVDVLELAARVSDAAAVTARFENPTMQAAECVVCHRTLDPVAGLFQDYWRHDPNFAIYGRRKEGWFTDMFAAGFEGEDLPADDRWRALAWLGERTSRDPRFARAMVGHAYYLLTGRRPMLPPTDLTDPLHESRRRAYLAQQRQIDLVTRRFIDSNFNFKEALKGWIDSDFYRADGLAAALESAEREAELIDLGIVRLLSPEQLERKIEAVFGQRWGRLTEQTAMLYGAIDSKEVTQRATDPSGAMGAIQRTLANDVACRHVALDFSRPAEERLLFAEVEPDVLPGDSAEADQRIRRTISHLHERILGRTDSPDSEEVARTYRLLSIILEDSRTRSQGEGREIYHCRQGLLREVPDPHYTVRAWRSVVTYLLRQPEFLYE